MALWRFRCRPSANRFMALSSDDEEERAFHLSCFISRREEDSDCGSAQESSFRPHGVPLYAKACGTHVRCPDGSTG